MSTQPLYQRSYTLRFTITADQEHDLPEHIADGIVDGLPDEWFEGPDGYQILAIEEVSTTP